MRRRIGFAFRHVFERGEVQAVSTEGEANLRGHITNEAGGDEGGGSSAYVPEDRTKDVQLKAAIDLLHGVKVVTNVKPAEAKKDEKKQSN